MGRKDNEYMNRIMNEDVPRLRRQFARVSCSLVCFFFKKKYLVRVSFLHAQNAHTRALQAIGESAAVTPILQGALDPYGNP